MDNASTKVAKQLMSNGVDLARIDASLSNNVVKILGELRSDLGRRVFDIDATAPTRKDFRDARLVKLLGFSKEEIKLSYKKVRKIVDSELSELAQMEERSTVKILNGAIGAELATKRLNKNVLESLARNTLVRGAPSSDWWANQEKSLRDKFEQEMRLGMLYGENNQQLVQRVRGTRARGFTDGIMNAPTNEAEALVRTSVQAVANEARMQTYRDNDDLIKGVVYMATLDLRTTPQCIALDGERWRLDGTKMKGTVLNFAQPPIHWRCRSTLTAIIKSWEELNANPKFNRILKKVPNRQEMRASLDGVIPDEIKYEEWLGGQSKDKQISVLGPTKYRLWKQGKLPFKELVDQRNNPYTVAEVLANAA